MNSTLLNRPTTRIFILAFLLATAPTPALAQSGTFTQFSRMVNQHACHTATLLPGGIVFAAGGALTPTVNTTLAADLYEPSDGLFYNFPELTLSHSCGSTATLLPGQAENVLIVGGSNAEIWSFSGDSTIALPNSVTNHTATLLANGTVLIAGGTDNTGNSLSSAEIFDPSTNTFSATGTMNSPRAFHTATLLANGKVLIAGGRFQCCSGNESLGSTLQSAEIFDPGSGTFSPAGNMAAPREQHSATMLANGTVLIAGGLVFSGYSASGFRSSAEIYDPVAGTFSWVANMTNARYNHTATLLQNGMVLVVGGTNSPSHPVYKPFGNALATAELFDPSSDTFMPTGKMFFGRYQHQAVLLSSGIVLITGGFDLTGTPLYSTELYHP